MIFRSLISLHLFFPKQTTSNGGFPSPHLLITHTSIYFYRLQTPTPTQFPNVLKPTRHQKQPPSPDFHALPQLHILRLLCTPRSTRFTASGICPRCITSICADDLMSITVANHQITSRRHQLLSSIIPHFALNLFQNPGQFLRTRQLTAEPIGQSGGEPIFGYANRFAHVPQRILSNKPTFALAQDDPDRRLIIRVSHHVVQRREIEIHLSGVFGHEIGHLQVNCDETSQAMMVKEQVEIEIPSIHFQMVLTPHEGKSHSQFEQEIPDLLY